MSAVSDWRGALQVEDQSLVPHKSPANPLTHNVPPSQSWLSFGMLHHLLCHSDTGTNTKRRAGGKIGFFFGSWFQRFAPSIGWLPCFWIMVKQSIMVEWQECFSCGRQEAEAGRKRRDKWLRILLIGTNFLQQNFNFHSPTQPNSLLRYWICQFINPLIGSNPSGLNCL